MCYFFGPPCTYNSRDWKHEQINLTHSKKSYVYARIIWLWVAYGSPSSSLVCRERRSCIGQPWSSHRGVEAALGDSQQTCSFGFAATQRTSPLSMCATSVALLPYPSADRHTDTAPWHWRSYGGVWGYVPPLFENMVLIIICPNLHRNTCSEGGWNENVV